MSGLADNQDNELIDLAALAAQGDELESSDQIEGNQESELSPIEQKAWDQGWRPEEDFQGDKDNWKTAKEYVKDGEWIAKINELKQSQDKQNQEFEERLKNVNKFHEAKREEELKNLKAQQRNAVEMADPDAFDAAQEKIDNLEKQSKPVEEPSSPAKNPSIEAWEAKNPWINDVNDERSGIAQGLYNQFANQNPDATIEQALSHVDEKLSKFFPQEDNSNPRRNQPNSTESGNRKSRRTNKDLTMGDLTPDERGQWAQFGKSIFKTEAAFLKAVKDSRNS